MALITSNITTNKILRQLNVVRGKAAKQMLDDMKKMPSEESKKGTEIIRNMFNKNN